MAKELRISAIAEGTVVDHIPPQRGLKVLKLLGLEGHEDIISLVLNVPSGKLKRKDVVKIENRLLTKEEFDRIGLVAPTATVNLIRDHEVVQKSKVAVPERMEGLLSCFNPNCVTNHERIPTKFLLDQEEPLQIRCHYCERIMEERDVLKHI